MAAEIRRRIGDSTTDPGKRASRHYEQASARVGEAVGELSRKGQDVRDDVAGAIACGAHEVEGFATAAKSGR